MNGFTSEGDDEPEPAPAPAAPEPEPELPSTSTFIMSLQDEIIQIIEERMLQDALNVSMNIASPYKTTITKEGLSNIKHDLYDDSIHHLSGNKCIITQEVFVHGVSKIGILPCNHYFDSDYIKDWLIEKPECPLCRYKMASKEIKKDVSANDASGGDAGHVSSGDAASGGHAGPASSGDSSDAASVLDNSLANYPTQSNLLNHILLLSQLENN